MSILVIVAALWVIHRGVINGIQRVSKLFVPLFGVMIITLIFMTLRLPGATSALGEFLQPDFSLLTPTSLFAALGQAFFSLSLGGTMYVVYGSYLRDDTNIPRTAVAAGFGDAGAALLASLFIVPTVLVLGINLQAGPMLIFETLPRMFAEIPAGRVIGQHTRVDTFARSLNPEQQRPRSELAQHRLVAVGQLFDELMGMGFFRGGDDLIHAGPRQTVGDVLIGAQREHHGILRD